MRSSSLAALAMAFVAGFLAVPLFHQIAFLLLHLAGIVPVPPYDMRPTAPFGVPSVVSASFWGGVWGIVFALTVARLRGAAYWITSLIAGGVALTLVYIYVVVPLKTGAALPNPGQIFVLGFILNAAWGIGWALFYRLFTRGAVARRARAV
jgi:hypothetical protein